MNEPITLSSEDMRLLEFEYAWWLRGPKAFGYKASEIRDTFGFSASRYQQRLNRLLDNPMATAARPMLVGRLRRLRAARRHAREHADGLRALHNTFPQQRAAS